jgi:hypothetical protein
MLRTTTDRLDNASFGPGPVTRRGHPRRRAEPFRRSALAAAMLAAGFSSAQAANVTWVGPNLSFWDLAANWTPGLPTAADDVLLGAANTEFRTGNVSVLSFTGTGELRVSGGTLQGANASSIGSLTFSAGNLGGAGNLAVANASRWTGGNLFGAGSTTFSGALSISGAAGKQITGGRTVNAGSTTWSGNTAANNNAIAFANSSFFNNTGTFTDSNAFASTMSGAGTFANAGTFNKQSNTVTTIGSLFANTGTVNVNAGTLLQSGGGTNSGTFNIANGATLEYRNGTHALNNVTMAGLGTFAITTENVGADAVVTLNGGTLTSQFLLGGSTMTGTDQVFKGKATWTGGTISGAASTTFDNDLTISGANTKVIVGGRVVNLNATTTWTGNTAANNNAIRFWNGATVNNNGTFVDSNPFASFIEHNTGGPHNFNNVGTYNKTANTITTVDGGVAFNNTGTVNINAGTLRPSGGGTSTGVFNIAAGATLQFVDGAATLNNATTQGAGTFAIVTDNIGGDAVVTVNGGTHTTPFMLSGSTLAGGDHTFQGVATWSGGAINGAASTTFANDVTITGANTKSIIGGRIVNLNATTNWTGNTADNNNAIRFWNGATVNNNGTFNDGNAFASFLEHNVGGPHAFNNLGTYNKTANTITTVDLGVVFNNAGTVNIDAGTMRFVSSTQGTTGTFNVKSGATFQHDANSTVGKLVTAGTTALSNRNLTVHQDYDNANFGTGNAFNPRANVTGTGLVLAAGATPATAQVLTGTGLPAGSSLTGGTTAAPTLTIGNVRVGDNALAYQVANSNAGGPAIRGAIQTTVGGANITDPRLSGSGVTAANFGPIAPGQNASFAVNFNAPTAGVLAPLTGQVVRIANNFDNVGEQNLNIVLGAGAAAYQLAAGQVNTPALNFGTVQVGQSVSRQLSISNIATGPAGFVEDLNARFGASTGLGANLISGTGSFANLAAGATHTTGLRVDVNTAAAGAVNGSIAVDFFSAGAVAGVSNGLGEIGVGSAPYGVTGTIQATGNVINQASPQVATTTVNLGNVRVGAASPTQAVGVTNVATAAPQAALNASISAAAPISASGSFNGLAPGASNAGALTVGMDTSSAGAKSGSATIAFVSDASNVGGCAPNCQLAIGSQNVAVSGGVYRLANPTLEPKTVTVAARVGDAGTPTALGITNASPDAFTERLNASFGTVSSGFAGSGAISGLAAGASSSAMGVGINTAAAGTYTGTAQVNFVSSGAGTTNAPDAALASQTVVLNGKVYTPAVAQVNTGSIDFGIVHKGDVVAARNVSVSNGAAVAAPNDLLVGSLGGAGGPFSASGTLAGVAAQASDTTSFAVGLNTANAGAFSGSATASFASHNADMSDKALGTGTVTLKAQVNNFAALAVNRLGGAGTLTATAGGWTLDFGTLQLGSAGLMAELGILNSAVGPADLLNGSFAFGAGSGFTFDGFGPFAGIAAGAGRGGLDIAFGSAQLGDFSQTITISSFGTNASGYQGPSFDTTLMLRGTVTTVAAIPEPETYLLMSAGLVAVWLARRRNRRESRHH